MKIKTPRNEHFIKLNISEFSVDKSPGALEWRSDIALLTFKGLVQKTHVLIKPNKSVLLNFVFDIEMVACFKEQREMSTNYPV